MNPTNHDEIVREADKVLNENIKKVENSPYKMAYHIIPPASWMNDPNGLIYWNGYYHVFYQFHPFDVKTGWMHWGHVRSKDLVHWERLPIALTPSNEYDRDGCFSGSAVDDNGILTLVYTGNIFIDREKDDVDECQCIATSADGIHFEKFINNPVIEEHPEEGSGHFRDPKVWKYNDEWYMVVGTRKDQIGKVLLYKSKDLRQWDYIGVMVESDKEKGYMWECPDLFELNGKHILITSPQGMEPEGDRYHNLYQTVYMIGDFDYTTGKYSYHTFEELDKGFDFYAAQTFEDDKGRRILFAWMDIWESKMPSQNHGWAGSLTIPREVSFNERGQLVTKPVEELQLLRKNEYETELAAVQGEILVDGLEGDVLEIIAEFDLSNIQASEVGLKVRCSEDNNEETVISYDVKTSKIIFNRDRSGEGDGGVRKAKLDLDSHKLKFHVYIDRSSMELFVNEGEVVMSGRVYPKSTSRLVKVFSEGDVVSNVSIQAWELEDVWK
ncbi:glycoside hydrolase family 32 protein [Cytobacillus sp. FJAT-54145]|uniref:Sucrose-6-phosphate hydrolase n=1 Tax=Cytobacillus spartinae TaxID=3299023 RepID=A0ABW6KE47_9BACI